LRSAIAIAAAYSRTPDHREQVHFAQHSPSKAEMFKRPRCAIFVIVRGGPASIDCCRLCDGYSFDPTRTKTIQGEQRCSTF
jgi:hypothetical protein